MSSIGLAMFSCNGALRVCLIKQICIINGKWQAVVNSTAAMCNVTIHFWLKMKFMKTDNFEMKQHCSKFNTLVISYKKM